MIDYTEIQKDIQIDKTAEDFYNWVEEQASFHQVTCDYFLREFVVISSSS